MEQQNWTDRFMAWDGFLLIPKVGHWVYNYRKYHNKLAPFNSKTRDISKASSAKLALSSAETSAIKPEIAAQ